MGLWSISSTRRTLSTPLIERCAPGFGRLALILRASALKSTSLTSVLLPLPLTPVTQTSSPSGKVTSMSFRLCCAAPRTTMACPPARLAAVGGHGDVLPAVHVAGRQALVALHQLIERAVEDDVPAVSARARTEVQHPVGAADGLLVVLDHQHRVPRVAQLLQRFEQADVVAVVQADGRLVEHVADAGQAAADLGGQADALELARG